jgi:proteasome lid subunit RPN8/RPN11
MAGVIRVRAEILTRLLEEARRDAARECCGLLAGSQAEVTHIFPATNVLASATSYEIAAEELFRMFREMRAASLDHLGIYHSHPTGDNAPSRRDLQRASYPDVAYFILSPLDAAPKPVRAFAIRDGAAAELMIEPVERHT